MDTIAYIDSPFPLPGMPSKRPEELPGLALAYVGDAIWEVYVRHHLIAQGETRPHRLHRMATDFVKAKSQAHILQSLMEKLSEEEAAIVRRGRNAKSGTVPKNADMTEYRHSTAFESLIGYLYLSGRYQRLHEIVQTSIEYKESISK